MERDNRRLYSSMRFEGDGVTKVVALTFELREGDGLSVDFGYGLVESGYTVDYDSQPVLIIFDEPLPKDQTITIRRLTQISEVPHVFQKTGNAQGGSPFNAKNIDENFENITRASQDAMDSQTLASETLEDMSGIKDDALKYRNEAEGFRNEAEVLRDSTIVKAEEASVSAGKAKTSEVNAKTSETNATESEANASASASSALDSATTATQEATKAGTYASNAKTSETNSKTSETNSKTSETNANSSASKAKTSETNAKTSETNANASATRASTSEVTAKTSETNAKHSEEEAKRWAEEAQEVVIGDILVEGEGDSTTKAMTQKSVTESFNNIRTDMQLIGAELGTKFDKSDLVNTSGQSTDKVMSQKAVTDFVSESTPIGTVQAYIGETAPNDKWLLCRGQAFSAESYPTLAQLLPDLKIPDLRGVALRGLDANRGFDPSRALLSYQEDAMQKMVGRVEFRSTGGQAPIFADTSGPFYNAGSSESTGHSRVTVSGGFGELDYLGYDISRVSRTSHETVMKNVAVNFIIKAR